MLSGKEINEFLIDELGDTRKQRDDAYRQGVDDVMKALYQAREGVMYSKNQSEKQVEVDIIQNLMDLVEYKFGY